MHLYKFKIDFVKDSFKYADGKQKNFGYKVIEARNSSRTKMLELQRLGRKKSGEDLNENETYNKRRDQTYSVTVQKGSYKPNQQ